MRETYLDNTADLAWLREVHWPLLPSNAVAAILYGNEDAPERIEAYDEAGYSDYAHGPLATWHRPPTGYEVQRNNGYETCDAGFIGLVAEIVCPDHRHILDLLGASPFVLITGFGDSGPRYCYVQYRYVDFIGSRPRAHTDYLRVPRSILSVPAH